MKLKISFLLVTLVLLAYSCTKSHVTDTLELNQNELEETGSGGELVGSMTISKVTFSDSVRTGKYRGCFLFDNTSDFQNIVKIEGKSFGATQGTSYVKAYVFGKQHNCTVLGWWNDSIKVDISSAHDTTKNISIKMEVGVWGVTATGAAKLTKKTKTFKAVGAFRGLENYYKITGQASNLNFTSVGSEYGGNLWMVGFTRTKNGLGSIPSSSNFRTMQADFMPSVGDVILRHDRQLVVVSDIQLIASSQQSTAYYIYLLGMNLTGTGNVTTNKLKFTKNNCQGCGNQWDFKDKVSAKIDYYYFR